jgi:hypothetical protein
MTMIFAASWLAIVFALLLLATGASALMARFEGRAVVVRVRGRR